MKKKEEEYPVYNLVEDNDIEELGDDIEDLNEDTDEILRRMDRNLQSQTTTNKRVTWLILLWILDKIVMLGMLLFIKEIFI